MNQDAGAAPPAANALAAHPSVGWSSRPMVGDPVLAGVTDGNAPSERLLATVGFERLGAIRTAADGGA